MRLADVGPVAAGFWRMTLAVPLLLALVVARREASGARFTPTLIALIILSGFFFAADLATWHYGILLTKLANATLFGNSSSFLFAIYGFVLIGAMPRPIQAAALLLAALGTALLLGSSYELSPRHLKGDLLSLLAGLFYACYLIVIDRARRTLAPMPVLALATIGGTLPLLVAAYLLGEHIMPTDWDAVDPALARQPGDRPGPAGLCDRPSVAGRGRARVPHSADGDGADRLDRLRRKAEHD